MEILSLTLQNFKGHADVEFQFTKGTNAICGENGAGKTSIFEAIAWVLFDHCDYQKKELIRTGTKSANAAVEFISSLDGRCYRIKRNTQRGYEIYDPQLQQKLNVKKRDDVQAWLCEHLGLPRKTELSRLFSETIGIPQGTFTADFLKRPGDRKKIFDPILKVEDYKQAYNNTRDLETHAKAQVSRIQHDIDLANAKLENWEIYKSEVTELVQQVEADQNAIAAMKAQLNTQESELAKLQAQAKAREQYQQESQQLAQQMIRLETQWQQGQDAIEKAQAAQAICAENQAAYEVYLEGQEHLQALQQKSDRYQALQQQFQQQQQQLNQLKLRHSSLNAQLEQFSELEAQSAQLKAQIPQQEQLEQQQRELQQKIQQAKVAQGQINALTQQIQQVAQQILQLQQELAQGAELTQQVQSLPELENERQQVMKALGSWEISQDWLEKLQPIFAQGKVDRDRHRTAVQEALKYLATLNSPQFTAIEDALKEGAILNTGLLKSIHQLLQELNEAASPEKLQQKAQALTEQIKYLQGLQQQLSVLGAKQKQQQDCDRQQQHLQKQLADKQKEIEQLPSQQKQQSLLEQQLEALGNPKAQFLQLKRQLSQQVTLQQQKEQLEQQLLQGEAKIKDLEQQLAGYESLSQEMKVCQTQQTQAQSGYQQYLQHQQGAAQLMPLKAQAEQLQEKRSQLEAQQAELLAKQENLSQSFDPDELNELQVLVRKSQGELGQLQGGLKPKQQRLMQLEQQLEQCQQVADQRERDRLQLKTKQETLEFIQEARRIYNQSGPRISEIYQQEISFEADRLFRELLHRQDVALRWTEDYDIQVQEAGYWRTFKSLSGGEQMCAALAVRLALLKTLGDINIAFFDEPTTNMDGVRRAQLAEAIANLKSFNQLFVISHDDTFETITESIIRVEPPER